MAKKDTLWPIARPTQAKHTILRKYLDACFPSSALGVTRTSTSFSSTVSPVQAAT
jgi:hypothetical protein